MEEVLEVVRKIDRPQPSIHISRSSATVSLKSSSTITLKPVRCARTGIPMSFIHRRPRWRMLTASDRIPHLAR